MKVVSIAYVPPPDFGCSKVFMENLAKFPAKRDLILYSEHAWSYPGLVKLKMGPEFLKGATFAEGPNRGKHNPFAVHNGIFLAGMKIAREQGASHVLYVEQDCRVGRAGWDEIIFEEYFSLGRPCVVAGTLSIYNASNSGPEGARRFQRLMNNPPKHGIPMGCYGWLGASTQGASCLFPNGALAVYDLPWVAAMFDLDNQGGMAAQNTAFDMAIGSKLWDLFSEDAYECVGSLSSVYSGYGDVLTSQEQRQELLTSGKVVGIHQIKDQWQP